MIKTCFRLKNIKRESNFLCASALTRPLFFRRVFIAFSILERIVMGETTEMNTLKNWTPAFSILERIVTGETKPSLTSRRFSFSFFQYPRTDRYG